MSTPASPATEAFRAARDQLLGWYGDPDAARERFRWPDVGPRWNWAVDWFDAVARGNGDPALVVVDEDGSSTSLTFDELVTRSDQLAVWLSRLGVGRGDAVLLMLGNQVELWETMLAVIKLGAVLMPTTTAAGPADLRDRVARGGARCVVTDPSCAARFDDVPGDYLRVVVGEVDGWADLRGARGLGDVRVQHPGTAPEDRMLLYFTSGTTDRPKLVEHSHASYPVGHLTTMYWLGLRPGDVHLNISSPGWAKHAWSCFFAPWNAGATVVALSYARFDPAGLLEQLRRQRVTTFCAPPTVWRMLIGADLSAGPGELREVVGAGEPLNPEVITQVQQAWGLTLRDGYGQTETTAQVGNVPGARVVPGSMGRPLPGVPVVLVSPETGRLVEGAGEGELCLDLAERPLPLMSGYQGGEGGTSGALDGDFYRTGDIASRDEHGWITYVGRTDDVFKASDYKISPFELESVLIEHPAVAEAAVVPAPDALRLAVPKAYVTLAPGHEPTRETAGAVLAHAREHLAPYQRVRRLEFAELPKTISGKIRRVELREQEEQRDRDRAAGGTPDVVEYRDDEFPGLRGR